MSQTIVVRGFISGPLITRGYASAIAAGSPLIIKGLASALYITKGLSGPIIASPGIVPDPSRATWSMSGPDSSRATWSLNGPDPSRATWTIKAT